MSKEPGEINLNNMFYLTNYFKHVISTCGTRQFSSAQYPYMASSHCVGHGNPSVFIQQKTWLVTDQKLFVNLIFSYIHIFFSYTHTHKLLRNFKFQFFIYF